MDRPQSKCSSQIVTFIKFRCNRCGSPVYTTDTHDACKCYWCDNEWDGEIPSGLIIEEFTSTIVEVMSARKDIRAYENWRSRAIEESCINE